MLSIQREEHLLGTSWHPPVEEEAFKDKKLWMKWLMDSKQLPRSKTLGSDHHEISTHFQQEVNSGCSSSGSHRQHLRGS
jgi:hypothetical protein